MNSQSEPSSQPAATRSTGRCRFLRCASFILPLFSSVAAPKGIRAAASDVTFPLASLSQSGSSSPCAELEGRSWSSTSPGKRVAVLSARAVASSELPTPPPDPAPPGAALARHSSSEGIGSPLI